MAYTRAQTNTQQTGNSSTFDVSTLSDVTSGSLLVVSCIRWRNGGNSNVLPTQLDKLSGTATIDTPLLHYWNTQIVNQRNGIWSCLVTGSGTLTLRVTHPTTAFHGFLTVAEYTGGVDWTPARAYGAVKNNGSGTTPTVGGLTTPAEGGIFFALMHSSLGSNAAVTEPAGYSLLSEWEDGPTGEVHSVCDRIASGVDTQTPSWTVGTTSSWYTGHLMFREGGVYPARMVV